MSAKKEFSALMRMMPLDVMVPTTGGLTLTLPTSGLTEKLHNPFGQVITIAGIKDEVVIMSSLQRPKKVHPPPYPLPCFCSTLHAMSWHASKHTSSVSMGTI